MAHVVVTIAGRTYRMACDDGEEPQVRDLAALVEEKILSMRGSFGDIGEQRSIIMAAIAIADETKSMREKLAALET
jgi:cell division protein ZapA